MSINVEEVSWIKVKWNNSNESNVLIHVLFEQFWNIIMRVYHIINLVFNAI